MENKKIKILAIDDNRDNLITLKAIISEVIPQSVVYLELSGQGGIASARKNAPDVILLDIVMPVMDGYQVCKTLKADEQLSEIPIIFLTALKGDKQSRILALEAGGEAFIAKPIDEIELKAQIHAMLKIKEAATFKRDEKLQLEALVQKRTEDLKSANTATLNLLEDLKTENEIRKQREVALSESEERFRVAQEFSPDGFTILHPLRNEKNEIVDFTWIYENQTIARFNGTYPEKVIGKRLLDLFPAHKGTAVFEAYVNVAKTKIPCILEEVYVGEILSVPTWFRLVVVPMSTDIAILTQDITSRKQAEEINKKLLNQFELISLHLPGVIYQFRLRPDGSFHFPYASRGIYNIYGVHPKDVEHDATNAFKAIHPDDLEQVSASIKHSAQTLTNWHDIYRINQPSGKTIWVEGNSTPQKMEDGSIIWHGFIQDITERKKAEEILKESFTLIKIAGEKAKLGGWTVNLDENRAYWSNEVAVIHEMPIGYSPLVEEGIAFYAPEWREKITEVFTNCAQNGVPYDEEMQILTSKGKHVWVRTIGEAVKDINGKIVKIQGGFQDITERKIAEEKIKETSDYLNSLFDYANAPIITWDTKFKITRFNHAFESLTGLSANEVLGKELQILFPLDSIQESFIKIIKTATGEFWQSVEIPIKHKNGGIRIVLWNSANVFDKDGKTIISTIAQGQDITERKQTEDQIQKLSQAVEQSPASIIITDTKGNVEYANPKTLEITGYELNELMGKNPKIFSSGEKSKSEYKDLWETILSGKEWRGEFHNKKKNGELYWEHASISPIINKKGEIINFLAVKEDITERNQILNDLIVAKEHAEESDQLKSAFLANMSHEIRTPMNGILGFAGLLKEPGLSGEKQQKYITIIEKSGERMLNIINDIVDISKIESGLMEVYITETDINEKIENLFNFFKPEAEAKNIQFSLEKILPKNEAIIKTDAEKVYAVLSNLLKNAIKFTNEGKIEFGVEYTRATNEQKQLKFFIKDSGIGIPLERQKAIFERFIQADIYDKMALQGAGLGLSIAKAYTEMLGGKIWVESEEGIGSVFYVTIPCGKETEKVFVQDAEESTIADEKAGNLKILIAEDDEASQMLLSTIVEAYSSEIFIANDGMEAVEIYKKNPDIDLILMDIQMPKLNGYEATKQIRQLNKKVVIIAQTAFALSFDKQKVIDAGCNDYISKPILKNDLTTLISKYFK